MVEEVKGIIHRVDDRYGQYELTTTDGYVCMYMFDTLKYEYFKPDEVSELE